MAKGSPTEERVRRGVARTVANTATVLVLLAGLAVWLYSGFYQLPPGKAAIILQLGRYVRTETDPGFRFHWPPPLQAHKIVTSEEIQRVRFGDVNATDPKKRAETAMQTSDNNIVYVEFVVRYSISDPFEYNYRIRDPEKTLRDSAQAAMREVVGRSTIDGVMADEKQQVQDSAAELLQRMLRRYDSGIKVQGVDLQDVQPPEAVREAFDEVLAANQDRSRKIREAEGYQNEVVPKARGEANEVEESAKAYAEAKIAAARGDAGRFLSLLAEYRRAPEITRKRLYLETMEEVLPGVEKILIEPGTSPVLPYLPLGVERGGRSRTGGQP